MEKIRLVVFEGLPKMFPHFVLILDCMAKTPFTFTKCSQKLIKGISMIKEKNIFLALQNWQI